MQPKQIERRRTLIVNQPAQKRIIAQVVLVPTAALALTSLVVAYFCRQLVVEASVFDIDLPSLPPLLTAVLGFCVVSCFVIALRGLRFSHRVAGPAYRLCKSIERIRAGDHSFRVKLREGDHLGEIAAELNRLLEHLDQPTETPRGPMGMQPELASGPADAEPVAPAFSAAGSSIPSDRG